MAIACVPQHAKEYAFKCHNDTGHMYDSGVFYTYHLQLTANVAMEFIHNYYRSNYLMSDPDVMNVISSCYCHDLIEDARQSYSDVKKNTNEAVAELVYAVTNEKGKTRKERASDKYYDGIRSLRFATLLAFSDRIANLRWGLLSGNYRMMEMYEKEHDDFVAKCLPDIPDEATTLIYQKMVEHMGELYAASKSRKAQM